MKSVSSKVLGTSNAVKQPSSDVSSGLNCSNKLAMNETYENQLACSEDRNNLKLEERKNKTGCYSLCSSNNATPKILRNSNQPTPQVMKQPFTMQSKEISVGMVEDNQTPYQRLSIMDMQQ